MKVQYGQMRRDFETESTILTFQCLGILFSLKPSAWDETGLISVTEILQITVLMPDDVTVIAADSVDFFLLPKAI